MKRFYQSKTVWYNLVMTLVDVLTLATDMKIGSQEVAVWLVFLHGLGNIILRIWFTDKPIG